jgi:DNA-binding NarL/FixJ family response regulator
VIGPTILIVDDHRRFRAAVRRLLEAGGFDVVGEVADGVSAVSAAADLRPDIVLLDVQLPDIDGFDVARRLAACPAAPATILISTRDAADYRVRLATTPARGFIGKADLTAAGIAALAGFAA